MIAKLQTLHDTVFSKIEAATSSWLPGIAARFVFAAVLFVYFINSAFLKVSSGFLGFFTLQDAAYFQILPKVVETYNYDVSTVPFFPYDIIVYFGTYSEIILPILIVLGLFTRLAALGMIGFIIVQSYVDVMFHAVDEKTFGAWFDAPSGSLIMDQRALWVFILIYLVIKGAGAISLDALLSRFKAS